MRRGEEPETSLKPPPCTTPGAHETRGVRTESQRVQRGSSTHLGRGKVRVVEHKAVGEGGIRVHLRIDGAAACGTGEVAAAACAKGASQTAVKVQAATASAHLKVTLLKVALLLYKLTPPPAERCAKPMAPLELSDTP